MRERPILFSAPMVRALLAGTKTQTRRLAGLDGINECPDAWTFDRWQDGYPDGQRRAVFLSDDGEPIGLKCPQDVDRLWVRETFWWDGATGLAYRADGMTVDGPWRSPLHMPRWASRITLEVTEVRVQRLQDISEEDARAEGFSCEPMPGKVNGKPATIAIFDPRKWYAVLWDAINGECSFASNPWVWAITFRRVQP